MSHAAAEAPPVDPGTGEVSPPSEQRTAPPVIESKPGYEAEQYRWDDAAPESEGGEPAPALPASPEAAAPATTPVVPPETPAADPLVVARAAWVEGKASKEQVALLVRDDPTIREVVDERANTRTGHLLQQEREKAAQQADLDTKWKAAASFHESYLAALYGSDEQQKAKAVAWRDSENGKGWLANYTKEAAFRETQTPTKPNAPLTQEAIQQAISDAGGAWNRRTAEMFAAEVRTKPFFAHLTAPTQKALTDITQEHGDKTWIQEWTDRIDRDLASHIRQVRADALEAGRNEGSASGSDAGPVQIAGKVGDGQWSAFDILNHHMEHGMGEDDAGRKITDEQLAWAKKQKGIMD